MGSDIKRSEVSHRLLIDRHCDFAQMELRELSRDYFNTPLREKRYPISRHEVPTDEGVEVWWSIEVEPPNYLRGFPMAKVLRGNSEYLHYIEDNYREWLMMQIVE